MTNISKVISSLAAVALIGGVVYWVLSGQTPAPTAPVVASGEDVQTSTTNDIAKQWQWQNFPDARPESAGAGKKAAAEDKSDPEGEVVFDVVDIYNILQSIQLDEFGRLVPDQTAKLALENGYADLGPDLSPEAMAELQDLIRIGLPGEAGEEAARILENYYRFRLAEEEFNQSLPKDGQLPTIASYEELLQMRRRYLGDDVADQLFAVEDIQARHMFRAIALQQDADLTDEERQARSAALQEKLSDRLLDLGELEPEEVAAEKVRRQRDEGASSEEIYSIREEILGAERARELAAADGESTQWENRFNRFWQARQYVVQAGLDEDESARQIEQLLGEYFSPEERERARTTGFERLTKKSE